MEQLVNLSFRDCTALLSYFDDLVLIVTGSGNSLVKAQQVLDIVNHKCEELGLKISADKSKALMLKTPSLKIHLRIQGVRLD